MTSEVTILRTTITKRAQTVVPAKLRERYNIKGGDFLEWIDDGQVIKVIPIPADPIKALRGSAKGEKLLEKLLASRQEDKEFE
jgi:AbrB family looped-hinge helix DNA binding protein